MSFWTLLTGPVRSATVGLWAVAAVGLGWLVPSAADAQQAGLFAEVPDTAAQPHSATSLDAMTARRRVVTMDLSRLRRAQASTAGLSRPSAGSKSSPQLLPRRAAVPASDATLSLNLFEDVMVTGIVERTAPTSSGGYSISGRLAGEPLGAVTLVVNGETVAGTVRTLGGTYQIRSVGGGLYAISEVEEPPLDCEVLDPQDGGPRPTLPGR